MEVTIEHLGAVQFEIRARQHVIASDQPPENGGLDEGMTPPELLLASIGSCAAFYAAAYLRKHHLPRKAPVSASPPRSARTQPASMTSASSSKFPPASSPRTSPASIAPSTNA